MVGRGRKISLDCAKHVIELKSSKRIAKDRISDRAIIEKVRTRADLCEHEIEKILSLHIDKVKLKLPEEEIQTIFSKAIHLFFRNEPRIRHNLEELKKAHLPESPVAFMKIKSEGSGGKAISKHFRAQRTPETAIFCIDSTVAIDGRNFCPERGLYNGSLGYAREIVFETGKDPNNGDLPLYTVIEFPGYTGPTWDNNNKKVSAKFRVTIKFAIIFLT